MSASSCPISSAGKKKENYPGRNTTISPTFASPKYKARPKKIRLKPAVTCLVLLLVSPAWGAEPVKKFVSTWFDYNPQIESGEKKNYNVLPLFVSSPERGQGFGIKHAQESLLAPKDILRLQAVQTLKNKSSYELKYEFPPGLMRRIGGEFEASFENYTKFYYGLGNSSLKKDESQYIPEYTAVRLPLLYGWTERIFLGIQFNYENWNILSTDSRGILPSELPKLIGKNGARFYTTAFLARWDSRNSKTDPTRGTFLEGKFEYSKKLTGSETDFRRVTVEARRFHSLFWKESHVMGVRINLDYKSGGVPFYRLPELGGIFFNRGLIEGRFRNNLAVSSNWEYRFRIYQRLHWAFFVDAGNVFGDFHAAGFEKTQLTSGTGMRYYVPPGNLLLTRVDGGYSTEGFLLYLTFDHPF